MELAEAIQKIETLSQKVAELASDNRLLRQELEVLRGGTFGAKTERLLPGQLNLFGTSQALPEQPSTAPQEVKAKSKTKGHGRRAFANHLPREVEHLDLPEEERTCSCCHKEMQCIGEEITERGHMLPAKVIVKRYVRKKHACPDGHELRTAEAPAGVIPKAKYEASVYAHLVASKYCDHLPLNRLEGIFKRSDLHLPEQTMWDMLGKVDELVAQPVIEQMRREILASEVLHSDDTTIKVQIEGQKGAKQGHVWTWRTPRPLTRADGPAKTFVEFTMGRNRAGPKSFLGNWTGTLIVDGLAVYNGAIDENGIKRAGCWSHARRGFVKALKAGTKEAAHVLAPMHRLFWLERAILDRAARLQLSTEDVYALRKRVRNQRSRAVQKRIFERAFDLQEQPQTQPDSTLGKALGYLINQAETLQTNLDDPRIPIHKVSPGPRSGSEDPVGLRKGIPDAERDLRHVAIGRKNYMSFASEKGGAVAARLYTLMLSAKHADLDPEAYINGLLSAIDHTPASRIADLTPWAWREKMGS